MAFSTGGGEIMRAMSQIIGLSLITCLITMIISGCIDEGENANGIDQNITPFFTPEQPDTPAPPAPKQLFIYPNSSETFQFWDYNMTISYLSAFPHVVEVTINGVTETIEINCSTPCPGSHCGYYVVKDDIDYSIKPVVWRYNEAGERIWSFETWNTTELYFEAHIKSIKR